jgi:hypothetical protein
MRRNVTVLDIVSDKFPDDVKAEINAYVHNAELGQDSYMWCESVPDEMNDDLGWDEHGIPHKSPLYMWLKEQGLDWKNTIIEYWW